AAVGTAEANRQTAKDAMDDTQVRARAAGTILELDAVLGTVISSPTLGGGTVILKMANLDTVNDSALVNETDIGKVQAGMPAAVTVDAYPNRQFQGTVSKIKPQAQVVQNATMFTVLVSIPNPGHLLKPGMNTEVKIQTGQRQGILAVPNAALRTQRDVGSAASVLGLDPDVVQQQVMQQRRSQCQRAGGGGGEGGGGGGAGRGGRGAGRGGGARGDLSGNYIVFALRHGVPVPVPVRTGLTDQDYIEVTSGGLTEQ